MDGAGSGLDADLLDGHDTSYFAPMRIGTSTVSFKDAAVKAGMAGDHGVDGIERFVSEVVPTITKASTAVVQVSGSGPAYGLWYYVLNQDYYCGILISYFSNLRTLRFSYDNGTYVVREI